MNKFDWFDKLTIYIELPILQTQGKLSFNVRASAIGALC